MTGSGDQPGSAEDEKPRQAAGDPKKWQAAFHLRGAMLDSGCQFLLEFARK